MSDVFAHHKPISRRAKMLVFGGRDYEDTEFLRNALDRIAETVSIGLVIHGGARGADKMGGAWAKARGIQVCVFEANWDHFPRAAGPIRNQAIIEWLPPEIAVGFPGGNGTANMRNLVRACGSVRSFVDLTGLAETVA